MKPEAAVRGDTALVEVRRGDQIRRMNLPAMGLRIGRAEDNDLVLDDPRVSRRHARIDRMDHGLCVTDLGSANGTRVNGGEIGVKVPVPLGQADAVSIADFTLRFSQKPGAEPGEPAEAVAPPAPHLLIRTETWSQDVALVGDVLRIGRDPGSDIPIDHSAVSRRHAELRREGAGYSIVDLNSTNGLAIAGAKVSSRILQPGDVIAIGKSVTLTYSQDRVQVAAPAHAVPAHAVPAQHGPAAPAPSRTAPGRGRRTWPSRVDLAGRVSITVGRDPANDISLDHPTVSRFHAAVRRTGPTSYSVEDLGSTNGTFVGGDRLSAGEARPLRPGDEVRVGPVKLLFTGEALDPADESGGLRVDVFHLNKRVGPQLNLLNDISFSISSHEFVAIVGVSGAGKSTLLDALNGFRPATEGAVLVNGTDLYQNLDSFRTELGYVPQEDIIHKELSPYQALDFAARLRLPADTTPEERGGRVTEVLQTLGILERKDVPITRLSGGQRKRVSIGVELLTRPGLFFLDEATSGLDPGTESQMMRLLRELADRGHTVVLITHATKNVMLCDQVVFLAKGGQLAYYGPPEEALGYFQTEDFDQIYLRLDEERTPEAWAESYRRSDQFKRFVVQRLNESTRLFGQASGPVGASAGRQAGGLSPGATVRRVSGLRQLITLSQRNLAILGRDRAALTLMLAIAPLIGLLDLMTWKKSAFSPVNAQTVLLAKTYLFLAALICVLVGAIASMREIVKESDVYRRERMVTLKIGPYVMSKVWLGILLALYQSAVFVITKKLAAGWPPTTGGLGQEYVTLVLATLSGMMLGLLISALAPNQNVAPLLLIVFLIPQFMFGGPFLEDTVNNAGTRLLAAATSTKWSYQALLAIHAPSRVGTGKPWADVGVTTTWSYIVTIIAVLLALVLVTQRSKDGGEGGLKGRAAALIARLRGGA